MYIYFKRVPGVGSGNYIYYWKSKGLSDESINSITASNYSITTKLSYYGTEIRVEFNGSCLKQDKITYNHGAIVNIYIVYELSSNLNNFDFALKNCLFGAVKLTKMQILISTNILDMILDFVRMEPFYFLGVKLLQM